MSVVGALTENGTIHICKFDKKGRLSRKRIVVGSVQYDTLFKARTGKPVQVLITDYVQNTRVLQRCLEKITWLKRLFFLSEKNIEKYKAKGAQVVEQDGSRYLKPMPIEFDYKPHSPESGTFGEGVVVGASISDREINTLHEQLRTEYVHRHFHR